VTVRPPDAAARLAAANLTPQEMEIAAACWWDGVSHEQVALWHRVTLTDIERVLQSARRKLGKAGLRIRPEVILAATTPCVPTTDHRVDVGTLSPEESRRPDGSDWRGEIDDRIDAEPKPPKPYPKWDWYRPGQTVRPRFRYPAPRVRHK